MARARECRDLVESFVNAESRRRMERVAERFEREALRAVDRELAANKAKELQVADH
jgi:hypothetical protein